MTRFKVAAFVALFGLIFKSTASIEVCIGTPLSPFEDYQPLFLTNITSSTLSFIRPKNGSIFLRNNEPFVVACSDRRNFLQNSNANISTGVCTKGKFKVANQLYDINELQCNKSIRGDIKDINKKCGNNEGYLTNIGYYVGRKDFLTLIEICYDGDKGNTLYSRHTIYGEAIRNASRAKLRPSFSTQGLGKKISASVAYKQAFQKSTFNKLLGSSALADLYINRKSYLARGHLAPDADFLFAAWQFTTYFYINACPQWQVINGGNWVKIESMIRKTAENTGEDLHLITGTHDVLSLPDAQGKSTEIFLVADENLPVPKFIWKLVYNKNTGEAIVIISLNNPFIENVSRSDYLCNSICKNYGWYNANWDKPEKGLIHCCQYANFATIVRTVPALKVRGVLRGPLKN